MKRIKYIILSLLLISMLLTFTACYRYNGDHKDLYTVAVFNVFGADGYCSNGEAIWNPNIEIIEKDNYGRTLFYYNERSYSPFGHAIVIMQQSNEEYVYYYQDDCYTPYYNADFSSLSDYRDIFSEEDIATLKERNDWNKEINLELCTKSPIIDRKEYATGVKEKDFEKAIKEYAVTVGYKGDDTIYRYSIYCNSDVYGRELYYVYGVGRDVYGEGVSPSSTDQEFEFAMIINPDKTCPIDNIYEISNVSENHWEIIKSLKQTAGWNQPYASFFEN